MIQLSLTYHQDIVVMEIEHHTGFFGCWEKTHYTYTQPSLNEKSQRVSTQFTRQKRDIRLVQKY